MTQPHSATADALERLVPDFDALVHDVRLGARSQRQYDEHEERAQRIAAGLLAAFRGGSTNPAYDGRSPVQVHRLRGGGVAV